MINHPESTGPTYSKKLFLKARRHSWQLLYSFVDSLETGIKETEAHEVFKKLLFKKEVSKSWHPPKIRFGASTLCSFKEPSPEDNSLQVGDVFFLDFGPVFFNHEGDVGQSFCWQQPDFQNPAQKLFKSLEKLWLEKGLSGEALYQEAKGLAKKDGYELNPKMAGHRLSDFPHALHHRGSLGSFEAPPSELCWVLEVHLIDQKQERGYFYEDVLGAEPLKITL